MLPSKKMIIFLAIFLVIVGLLAIFISSRNSTTNYTNPSNNLVVASSTINFDSEFAKKDSDDDDLPDWEEALYGTDPKNNDSDGDGTPDGKEIKENRNPLVKGPNDKIVNKTTDLTAASSTENLTPTDIFARDFFAQYAALSESGVKITADNAEQIAGQYLKNAPLPNIKAKILTEEGLKIIDSNRANLKAYQDSYISIFSNNWPNEKNNEMLVLNKTFGQNEPEAISGMVGVINIYTKGYKAFSAVPVPKTAVTEHLKVLNSMSIYIETLKMIGSAFNDPMSGYVALNSFLTNQSNMVNSMASLRIFLINSLK